VEKALILTVGLLLGEETIENFRDRASLLFRPLDLVIEGARHSLEP
jgi:hypothetical protein